MRIILNMMGFGDFGRILVKMTVGFLVLLYKKSESKNL